MHEQKLLKEVCRGRKFMTLSWAWIRKGQRDQRMTWQNRIVRMSWWGQQIKKWKQIGKRKWQWSWERQWWGWEASAYWQFCWFPQCLASAGRRSSSTVTLAGTKTLWSLSAPSSPPTAAPRSCTTSRWDKRLGYTLLPTSKDAELREYKDMQFCVKWEDWV